MRSKPTIFIVLVCMLALLVAGTATAATERPTKSRAGRTQLLTERLAAGELALDVRVEFEQAHLAVTGPRNSRIHKEFAAGEAVSVRLVDEAGNALPDGRYSYTLSISPRPAKGSSFKRGLFFIDDGVAISREARRAELGRTRDELNLQRGDKFMQARRDRQQRREGANRTQRAEAAPPSRPGADPSAYYNYFDSMAIYDSDPYLKFYSPYLLPRNPTGSFAAYYYGSIYGGGYTYDDPPYGFYPGIYTYGATWNNMYGGFGNFIYAIINSFYGFDYTYNYAYYGNYMGSRYHVWTYSLEYNWSTAGHPFYYDPGYPGYLYNIAYAYSYYGPGLYIDGGIAGLASKDFYLGIFNGVYATPWGVGINTTAPAATLHVAKNTGAQVFVENTSTTVAERVPFKLQNNGKTRFEIKNGTQSWTFDNDGSFFNISAVGTGLNEFRVQNNGDGFFRGDVTANGVLLTSSREKKEAVKSLDEQELLAKLMEVPVSEWQFKQDDSETRHIGPMAEDFQKVFGSNDGKHLSVTDVQGVTMAAIQGLNAKLEQENAALRARLANLEAKVASLVEDQ